MCRRGQWCQLHSSLQEIVGCVACMMSDRKGRSECRLLTCHRTAIQEEMDSDSSLADQTGLGPRSLMHQSRMEFGRVSVSIGVRCGWQATNSNKQGMRLHDTCPRKNDVRLPHAGRCRLRNSGSLLSRSKLTKSSKAPLWKSASQLILLFAQVPPP